MKGKAVRKYVFSAFVLCVLLMSVPAYATLQYTFDADTQGWTTVNDANFNGWQSSGGNPDGYIKATDKGYGSTWYFVSPSLGDMSSYKGGTLSYDINLMYKSGSYFDNDEVIIKSGSSSMSWAPTTAHEPGTNTWTTYSVDLTSANFVVSSGTFDGILSNVTAICIRGEYISGGDIEGLDNVKMTSAPVPLPLPILFLGSGLAGLAALRTRMLK
ncbi:Laminin B (Domain IV) [Syntrophus gentianae]|uniref:Laminin B (Domain IV) n=1 Tax=Syntrophus gentianae TaxID=43775 RepID=A0A1H7VYS4_9BACT|nr:laminin B domain-containing protein [Syntrophus gentianae]SEM14403.1 Laminin B (Domain IV) [Syntrophus gentianae]